MKEGTGREVMKLGASLGRGLEYKHLFWCICKGCLPTRSRLTDHHVNCQMECSMCLHHEEKEWHLFFECEGSREAWN
ncbi:unnamed protein product [Trifolium pratense]|uniref:Uncharacterized protein n=1 Tax=Trifolium pratense TaxID=57577 RepID=A0ACB0JUR2_TRIPR|nr:unnamed protein product [Trifolium pratense]